MRIISRFWLDDFSQNYGPLKFSIVHTVQFLSELFLSNLLREFNEPLWEASLPTGDVHIISRLWSDEYCDKKKPLGSITRLRRFLVMFYFVLNRKPTRPGTLNV